MHLIDLKFQLILAYLCNWYQINENRDMQVASILPSILLNRRNNRGAENVAVSPDGSTAYMLLQVLSSFDLETILCTY